MRRIISQPKLTAFNPPSACADHSASCRGVGRPSDFVRRAITWG